MLRGKLLFSSAWDYRLAISVFTLTVAGLYLYMLGARPVIYADNAAHDIYIFIDGAYRILHGQLPHLDFVTGIGGANFFTMAWLAPYADSLYQAFLWNQVGIAALFLLVTWYVALSRLTVLTTVALVLYLAVILLAPLNIGGVGGDVTFAMFYNRFGWAALLLALVFVLPSQLPNSPLSATLDVLCVAFLLLFTLYTKATFCLGILLVLLCMLLFFPATFWRRAIAVALVTLSTVALVEVLMPGYHLAYLADLILMVQAKQEVGLDLAEALRSAALPLLLIALAYWIVWNLSPLLPQANRWKRFGFSALFLALAILIFTQNAQERGMTALLGLLLVYIVLYTHSVEADRAAPRQVRDLAILHIILLVFVLPEFLERNVSMDSYRRSALEEPRDYPFPVPERLRHYAVSGGTVDTLRRMAEENAFRLSLEDYSALISRKPPKQEIYQLEYVYTLARGAEALRSTMNEHGEGTVNTWDFVNPFSYILELEPAGGNYLWYHHKLNFSSNSHLPADAVFGATDYIMVPRYPVSADQARALSAIYGGYLEDNFILAQETPLWQVYRRKAGK